MNVRMHTGCDTRSCPAKCHELVSGFASGFGEPVACTACVLCNFIRTGYIAHRTSPPEQSPHFKLLVFHAILPT